MLHEGGEMIHCRVRCADGSVRADPPLEDLHRLVDEKDNLVWLDLEAPSADDVALVAGLFGWEHLTTEDVTKQGQRAKLEHYSGYFYLVMHDLVYDKDADRLSTPEVDFIVGSNYVTSVHEQPFPHVTEAREVS